MVLPSLEIAKTDVSFWLSFMPPLPLLAKGLASWCGRTLVETTLTPPVGVEPRSSQRGLSQNGYGILRKMKDVSAIIILSTCLWA